MRPSTAIIVVGLVIFAIAAVPLVEFTYSIMEGRAVSVRVVPAANVTRGAPCGSNYYEVTFSYSAPVPLTDAEVWATFATPSGNLTYSKAVPDLSQGSNVTLCVPSGVVSGARAVSVGLSGDIAGIYPVKIELEEQVSMGG